MKNNKRKIFLLGPQGSGKGTQAARLAKKLSIPAISVGQLLRQEVRLRTETGKEIQDIVARGALVPDRVTARVLRERLGRPDAAHGYILDGFPRNVAQMKAFDFDEPTHVIVLNINRDEAFARIADRLTCTKCGHVYQKSLGYMAGQSCECGGILEARKDDEPETIAKRLDVFEEETRPVIGAYDKQGIACEVNAMGSIEEVEGRLMMCVG
ncbi:nucleoside monophosphate kinase [Candidatus Uhrbacteria bacterium]|nr:nucleoside monophosphate kinase [Candidatus Uhrbacteria bacterium]